MKSNKNQGKTLTNYSIKNHANLLGEVYNMNCCFVYGNDYLTIDVPTVLYGGQ